MPRVECGVCRRDIAAGIVAGRPGKGRLWRHDPEQTRRSDDGSLLSCPGSLEIVDLPLPMRQLEIAVEDLLAASSAQLVSLF